MDQRHGQFGLGSATGCPLRRMEWTKPCISGWERLRICKPWSSPGVLQHSIICWRGNVLEQRPSQRLLARVSDNFLLQVLEEAAERDAMLEVVLTNRRELVGHMRLPRQPGLQ